mgnify:CR=1 FL=1
MKKTLTTLLFIFISLIGVSVINLFLNIDLVVTILNIVVYSVITLLIGSVLLARKD